jgi:hypothetical protein
VTTGSEFDVREVLVALTAHEGLQPWLRLFALCKMKIMLRSVRAADITEGSEAVGLALIGIVESVDSSVLLDIERTHLPHPYPFGP